MVLADFCTRATVVTRARMTHAARIMRPCACAHRASSRTVTMVQPPVGAATRQRSQPGPQSGQAPYGNGAPRPQSPERRSAVTARRNPHQDVSSATVDTSSDVVSVAHRRHDHISQDRRGCARLQTSCAMKTREADALERRRRNDVRRPAVSPATPRPTPCRAASRRPASSAGTRSASCRRPAGSRGRTPWSSGCRRRPQSP